MGDLVSIVMPSYNTSQFIAESIQSVQSQSYTNWELIIVDDCSTDDTEDVVKLYLNDKRIRYLKNEKNSGTAVSRNRALREAKGKWIAFLDSDDLWRPRKLEKQVKFMENNDYHFSYTSYSEIDTEGKENAIKVTGPKVITRTGMNNYCWPGCLTVMYDAEKIGIIQIADIKKNNDYAMWLMVARKASCYLLDEDLAMYRRGRAGSISTNSVKTMIRWHYRLFREVERQSIMTALFSTGRNLLFGTYKKIIYVRNKR
ncbi:MAG: glycosyltransferase family 2 protein [Lachnospiraceae bacterium]|nr:glycosyltransferase family 2 protein [Lachnospiraceae bacterium]